MGFMDKVKGFLNIGGPKVSIVEVTQPITGKAGTVVGRASIVSKRQAKVVKFTQKFFVETTTGKGEEKTTETTSIAEANLDLQIELQPNVAHELAIHIPYDTTTLTDKMAGKGGMLGALGKAAQFAGKFAEKGIQDYFVEVTADVVGTPLDPSDKVPVRAVLAE